MLFDRNLYFMISVFVSILCLSLRGSEGQRQMENSVQSESNDGASSLSTTSESGKAPVANRRGRVGYFKPPTTPDKTSNAGASTDPTAPTTDSDATNSPSTPSDGSIDGRMRGNSGIGLRGLSSSPDLANLASGKK